MAKQKFTELYIEEVNKQLNKVMFQEPGVQDWTQFSLSVRDAMLAAATIFGSSTDEQKHNLYRLLYELVTNHVLFNLNEYEIQYIKKSENNG